MATCKREQNKNMKLTTTTKAEIQYLKKETFPNSYNSITSGGEIKM
jgi:hypothetical protein